MKKRSYVIITFLIMLCMVLSACTKTDTEKVKDKTETKKVESEKSPNKEADKAENSGNTDKQDEKADTDEGKTSSDKNSTKNIRHKFYELYSINGYTKEDFLNNDDLDAADYGASDFVTYGTGLNVDFDYDNGYIQYTWQHISPNSFSTTSIDSPSAVMNIINYDMWLNVGEAPDVWATVDVAYGEDEIVVTYLDGGGVEVYRLASDDGEGKEFTVKTDTDRSGANTEKPSGNNDSDGFENGGTNYEYEIVSAYFDNGLEAAWNPVTWFISYQGDHSVIQAPIWEECKWEESIGTEEEWLPADFTKGELTLTPYSAGGELGTTKTLYFEINGDSATIYNMDDGITYNCILYRSFSF